MEHTIFLTTTLSSTSILTRVRHSHELAIRRLGTIDDGNLDDGFEDRAIDRPVKGTREQHAGLDDALIKKRERKK